jgi:hypothetical protein
MSKDRGPEEPGKGDKWKNIDYKLKKINEDYLKIIPKIKIKIKKKKDT